MIIKDLGLTHYEKVYDAMRGFTDQRNDLTKDELWVTEHHPVFTQGLAGKQEHILQKSDVPIVATDRGGQITYHGPKQILFYPLLNLKQHRISPRPLVSLLEKSTINALKKQSIIGYAKVDAPGIYVQHDDEEKKIASLGLRIRKGCCYHGLSLNMNMDLSPFSNINPCGYQGLKMVNICDLNNQSDRQMVISDFIEYFIAGYKKLKEGSIRG